MKKSYKLQELDCANCAAKMERALNKMPEITHATVSFMTQRLCLEAEDSCDEAQLLEKAQKIIQKVEPACRIITK